MADLDKSMEILNSKPEERTETDEDVYGEMVAVTLKQINPYQKIIGRKKLNDTLFEIELSDYKKQQSHPKNEHFGGSINISNSSNMTSQNSYSILQATYGKTSLPVSPYDGETSTYSELILF